MNLAEMTAPELRDVTREGTVVVAPLGAIEQHGRHMPVATDTLLVDAVAREVERSLPDRVILLPVLWLGASEHHLVLGGTLTATLPTYEQLLVELVTPLLREGFRRVLLLSGHGGNVDPIRAALRRLAVAFPRAILTGAGYWEPAEADLAALCTGPRKTVGHGCEIETSLLLHLRPELVRTALWQD